MANIPTQKDADQVLRYAFDDDNNAIRVDAVINNPANGVPGQPAPPDATQVGGVDPSGNLQALHLDNAGNLLVSLAAEPGAPVHVIVDSSALPTGAATEAKQDDQITQETAIATSVASLDSKTVTVDTDNVTVVATALAPDASTETTALAIKADLDDLNARLAGGFVPALFDEADIAYVGASTDIDTVTYKLAGSTVAVLTMTYDGSDRLTKVVKT